MSNDDGRTFNIAGRDNVDVNIEGDLWYQDYRAAIYNVNQGKSLADLEVTLRSLRDKLQAQRTDFVRKSVFVDQFSSLDAAASKRTLGLLAAHIERTIVQILDKDGHAELQAGDIEWPSKVLERLRPVFLNEKMVREMHYRWIDLSAWYQSSRYYLRLINKSNIPVRFFLRCISLQGKVVDNTYTLEPNCSVDFGPSNSWIWEAGERFEIWNAIGPPSLLWGRTYSAH